MVLTISDICVSLSWQMLGTVLLLQYFGYMPFNPIIHTWAMYTCSLIYYWVYGQVLGDLVNKDYNIFLYVLV